MGWSYTKNATRRDIIEYWTGKPGDVFPAALGEGWQCLAHSTRGNVLWTVEQRPDGHRFIGCMLLSKERGYGWGSKAMEESMHPYYYSCPLAYLDMVPQANAAWREGVRAYHERRSLTNWKPGMWFRLPNCKQQGGFKLESLRPLRATYEDGRVYRIPLRMMSRAVLIEAWESSSKAIARGEASLAAMQRGEISA